LPGRRQSRPEARETASFGNDCRVWGKDGTRLHFARKTGLVPGLTLPPTMTVKNRQGPHLAHNDNNHYNLAHFKTKGRQFVACSATIMAIHGQPLPKSQEQAAPFGHATRPGIRHANPDSET